MRIAAVLPMVFAALVLAVSSGCQDKPESGATSGPAREKDAAMRYEVVRAAQPIPIDANWDKPAWQNARPVELTYYMGDKPAHFPKVQAKLAYDPANLYVIFRVEDNYVRAVAAKHQDAVCRDSCCEFFFTPGTDVAKGYFNLEMNCGGTMLLNYQVVPWKNQIKLTDEELSRVEVAHSLPKNVNPEIAKPTVWTIEYRFPVELMGAYLPTAAKPAPGVEWRANLYKCADATSHPHWLTWSKVDRPRPDFHVPEYFGTLVFK